MCFMWGKQLWRCHQHTAQLSESNHLMLIILKQLSSFSELPLFDEVNHILCFHVLLRCLTGNMSLRRQVCKDLTSWKQERVNLQKNKRK